MTHITKLLKKFQAETETQLPSLDQALRRAAVFGEPRDIENLVQFGANINAQDPNKRNSPLLCAVKIKPKTENAAEAKAKKIANVKCLIKLGSNKFLKDADGKTAKYYAKKAENHELVELLSDKTPTLFKLTDFITSIMKYLPLNDVVKNARVRSVWQESARLRKLEILKELQLTTTEMECFSKLPEFLKYIILTGYAQNKARGTISLLLEALSLPSGESKNKFFLNREEFKYLNNRSYLYEFIFSDIGVILHLLGLYDFSDDDAPQRVQAVCSEYGALIFAEGLVTKEQLKLFRPNGGMLGTHDNSLQLFTKNGYQALHKKLIIFEHLPYILDLKALLSKEGLIALEENLITSEQAKGFYPFGCMGTLYDNLRTLLTPNGLVALRNKWITVEQAHYIYIYNLQYLLSNEGLALFEEGFISLSHLTDPAQRGLLNSLIEALPLLSNPNGRKALAKGYINLAQLANSKVLKDLLSDNGLKALEEELITAEQAATINDLSSLLSDQGIEALRTKLLTPEKAKHYKSLAILTLPNGLNAIREGLISFQQAARFTTHFDAVSNSLKVILSNLGIQALREKLITPEQAAGFYHSGTVPGSRDNLQHLITPLGLEALRQNLITPEQASHISSLDKLFGRVNTDVLLALKYRLIKPEDFTYGGKYRITTIQQLESELKTLLSRHHALTSEATSQAATTIQVQGSAGLTLFKLPHDSVQKTSLPDVKEVAQKFEDLQPQ